MSQGAKRESDGEQTELDESLREACRARLSLVAASLIKQGAKPLEGVGERHGTLFEAAGMGASTLARALVEAGADIEGKGFYGMGPLARACASGRVSMARELLDLGARIDRPIAAGDWSPSLEGMTPLMLAAFEGRFEVVELLIERGADPLLANALGETASAVARDAGHEHIARIIDARARILTERAALGSALAPARNSPSRRM